MMNLISVQNWYLICLVKMNTLPIFVHQVVITVTQNVSRNTSTYFPGIEFDFHLNSFHQAELSIFPYLHYLVLGMKSYAYLLRIMSSVVRKYTKKISTIAMKFFWASIHFIIQVLLFNSSM